jgi:hypothetical protein
MAHHLPHEGAGWRYPFIGPWLAATTSLRNFDVLACQPGPLAWAVGTWYGALHAFGAIVKPVPWAPSLGEGSAGTPHGGRKGGRSRERNKSKARFRSVWNLEAETEFNLDSGLKMALFDLGKVALEVGYIIFLADIVRDSLLIGTTAAYRYGGCVPDTIPGAQGHMNPQLLGPATDEPVKIYPDFDPGNLIGDITFRVPAGVGASVQYGMSIGPWSGTPEHVATTSFYIKDLNNNSIVAGCGAQTPSDSQSLVNKMGNYFKLPVRTEDGFYQIRCHTGPGYAEVQSSNFSISDSVGLEGSLLWDP